MRKSTSVEKERKIEELTKISFCDYLPHRPRTGPAAAGRGHALSFIPRRMSPAAKLRRSKGDGQEERDASFKACEVTDDASNVASHPVPLMAMTKKHSHILPEKLEVLYSKYHVTEVNITPLLRGSL